MLFDKIWLDADTCEKTKRLFFLAPFFLSKLSNCIHLWVVIKHCCAWKKCSQLALFEGTSHRSRGKFRKVKKMQDESEGAMKISALRASKRAPTWHSCTVAPKSLSGQPLDRVWIRRSRGWPERDFGVMVQLCHVGARFEALNVLIFMEPSDSSCFFLSP